MPQQNILLFNGLGGLANSYSTPQDLTNLALPEFGKPATIDSVFLLTNPLNVNTLTLSLIVSIDGFVQPQYTQTFTTNYATLDLLVGAIAIPGITAINNAGRLRLQTNKVGVSQTTTLDYTGTANLILGFNTFFDTTATGESTFTDDLSADEITYNLVAASSIANGFLKRRYNLPLTQWDFDLVRAVCDLSLIHIYFGLQYAQVEQFVVG